MKDHIKQNLINEIDALILEGYHSYQAVPETNKHDLVALYMDTMGKAAIECLIESDDLDIVIHKLRQFAFSGSTSNAYDLAETMRDNTEKYLSRPLQELYAERASIIECELKREAGLKPYQHKDNGEIAWIRA